MEIKDIAQEIIDKLKDDFVIQRYDSVTTNSVYLKLDYGVCNSIRISDHDGKKKLSYRYNILVDLKKPFVQRDQKGLDRRYYPVDMIDYMIQEIQAAKRERITRYGEHYESYMMKNVEENTKGFWKYAKRIN